jgi:hypothetical protein
MKYNKIVTAFCAAALGLMSLTSCEGGDLFSINAPDWLSSKADSIAAEKAKNQGDDVIEGMEEDVYTVGATDYSTGWWAQFSKYYQIPEGGKWIAQFNLNINPNATNTYKNFALIITNDENRGAGDYKEYGAIRYDNQPSGNSEWGDYIDRSLVTSDLTFDTDTDTGVDKLGGKVTLTIDRTSGGLVVTMTNGVVTKVYNQTSALTNLNADASNGTIRAFMVPEGSFINFLGSTIEPIGGFTSREDKQPLSMTLNSVPKKVLQGTTLEDALANVTATIQFEQEVSATVSAKDLTFQVIPDMYSLGKKTLVAAYAKTFKGEAAAKPVIASTEFNVVDKLYTSIGAGDNTSGFREEKTENFKVAPGETYINHFTNYTNGAANWNNFIITLCKADNSEYCFVRADNWGTGTSYWDGCQSCDWNWDTFTKALDGAKVTTYITNNGDGTADVIAVVLGSDGNTYTQMYNDLNNIDPNDFYFNLSTEKGHLEFDYVIGNEDNTSGFREVSEELIKVPAGATYVERFINHTDGAANWNNFIITLCTDNNSEYCFVRADNWGTGASYWDGCQSCNWNWDTFREVMDGAIVTTYITNNGDGTADVKAVVEGADGNTYTQIYSGLNNIDPDNFCYTLSMEKAHLVFE